MNNKRSRSYVFTWNNPTLGPLPSTEDHLRSLQYSYITYGREVGEQGTPHLQGYIHFINAKTLNAVRALFTGAHVELLRGTSLQAITYCQKEGDYYEDGQRPVDPGLREKIRWQEAWDSAKRGAIEEIDPDIRVRCYSGLLRIYRDYAEPPAELDGVCGIWVWGRAGSGKTSAVLAAYASAYQKNASKWWDGYRGQTVAVLDDIGHSEAPWITRFLKIWADRYPFMGESKGSSQLIRPHRFVVTSQYSIEQLFLDIETRSALIRRFFVMEKKEEEGIILC
nr:MAG: replication associated protein [Cressdnaviricota sp.]